MHGGAFEHWMPRFMLRLSAIFYALLVLSPLNVEASGRVAGRSGSSGPNLMRNRLHPGAAAPHLFSTRLRVNNKASRRNSLLAPSVWKVHHSDKVDQSSQRRISILEKPAVPRLSHAVAKAALLPLLAGTSKAALAATVGMDTPLLTQIDAIPPIVSENPVLAGALLLLSSAYLGASPGVGGSIIDSLLLAPLQALEVSARGTPTRDCMVVGNKIGAGNFGDVFEALWTKRPLNTQRVSGVPTNEIRERLIVKRVKMQEDGAKRLGEVEQYMNRRLLRSSPGVCAPFIGSFISQEAQSGENEQLWLVWKYDGLGTLGDYLSERDFPLNMETILFKREQKGTKMEREARVVKELTRQLLQNVKAMHDAGIIHRDVKPDNILVSESGKLKMLDLGAAVDLRNGFNYIPDEAILDPSFAPPERFVMPETTPKPPAAILANLGAPVIWAKNQPDKFDTYSVGVILAQMSVPGVRSMDPKQFARTLQNFDQDVADWRLKAAQSLGWDILDADGAAGFQLLAKLLDPERSKRPTASQALSSKFLASFSLASLSPGTVKSKPSPAAGGGGTSRKAAPTPPAVSPVVSAPPPAKRTAKAAGGTKGGTKGTVGRMVSAYSIGQRVEYNSPSNKGWVSAVVKKLNADGTVDLDIKNRADPSSVRAAGRGAGGGLFGNIFSASRKYEPGELVEYRSTTNKNWVGCRVVRVNEDGTIDLDIKPNADPKLIRKASKQMLQLYAPGEAVEYRSTTNQNWVECRVVRVNSDGTVDLDIKPNAELKRIRKANKQQSLLSWPRKK